MGIPKFFRWMSERYPLCSQLIAENRIPEFDNLYLDMNGIIHNCTHSDGDATTHMTEDKMYIAIFNYIEHLFAKIKPRKLFFMAIDGVAPRAKMNQQRSRRFRTALDNENARKKAIQKGEVVPDDPFDSNCITPGTVFMANLSRQLQYWINKKVSEDSDWRGVQVILSGHDVPGEGEHKVMEYIRLAKAQSDYDPNLRHCLYGLDADLIMLGLLSHEPHFCLLREEVNFGPSRKTSKHKDLDAQNFYLMHLCILREYLDLEFQNMAESLPFEYDLERVIDDFVLLAFFVGNDFLPHLPNLHINEGALALMFKSYKRLLPKAGGYINDNGTIDLQRLSLMLEELETFEKEYFEAEYADANWFKGKAIAGNAGKGGHLDLIEKAKKKNRMVLTPEQKAIFEKVKSMVLGSSSELNLEPGLNATDKQFVQDMAKDLHLVCKKMNESGDKFLRLEKPAGAGVADPEDMEAFSALTRELDKYDNAPVITTTRDDAEREVARQYEVKFDQWKDEYYREKLGFGLNDEKALKEMTETYVQGLQWVLKYYYQGVASWGWFYKYHYAPKISDVRKGLGANLKFDLGSPFRPFDQLMGVLPERSKKLIPEAFRELMTEETSPITDFYPRDFDLDLNGKKQDWEAVVKIPFIDEKRLIAAMQTREKRLTKDEKQRNSFGSSLSFTFDESLDFVYHSSLPNVFPEIGHCHCKQEAYELPTVHDPDSLGFGLCDGVKLGIKALAGFPTLHTIPYTGTLAYHGVSVFQQESRNETMVITLENVFDGKKTEEIAKEKVGQAVFVNWPYLQEAKVVAVSDEMFKYEYRSVAPGQSAQLVPVEHTPMEVNNWRRRADRLEHFYSKRGGTVVGPVEVMLHVHMLQGLKRTDDGAMVKEYVPVKGDDGDFAVQSTVADVQSVDERFIEQDAVPVEEDYPEGTRAFFLGEYNYGRPLEVIGHSGGKIDIWLSTLKGKEPDFGKKIVQEAERSTRYRPTYVVTREIRMHPLILSKITASFTVVSQDTRINLGLNLKFERKMQKVLGYTRKTNGGWELSDKAVALIQEYQAKFPEFFAALSRNPNGDMYRDTDIWGDVQTAKNRINEIKSWLKEKEARDFERVPLDAEQLDGDVVKKIEQCADAVVKEAQPPQPKKVKGVPRKALLKPQHAENRLQGQRFALGDRVVYVQDSGKVPIATRGTVVGVSQATVDVLYDTSFMSGTTLGGRCSPYRGMTVSKTAVLNVTQPSVITSSQAAKRAPAPAGAGAQAGPVKSVNGGHKVAVVNGGVKPAGTPAKAVVADDTDDLTKKLQAMVMGHQAQQIKPQHQVHANGHRPHAQVPHHGGPQHAHQHRGPPPPHFAPPQQHGGRPTMGILGVPVNQTGYRPPVNMATRPQVQAAPPQDGAIIAPQPRQPQPPRHNPHGSGMHAIPPPPSLNAPSQRGRGRGRGRGGFGGHVSRGGVQVGFGGRGGYNGGKPAAP
ncbi:exonuclease II Exo2 [Saitoella coloradoensis]